MTEPLVPMSDGQAGQVLREVYRRDAPVRRLDTEKDDTFVVGSLPRLLLKVAHRLEDPAVVELQAMALRHVQVADPGLPVQRVVETADGGLTGRWSDHRGHRRATVLLTFLDGLPLVEVPRPPDSVLIEVGRLLGRTQLALAGFAHPGADRDDLVWDLRELPGLAPLVDELSDVGTRDLLRRCLGELAAPLALARALPAQVCHHDVHPGNVLVDGPAASAVTGLIDFGDLCRTAPVCDLAVCLAYTVRSAGPAFAAAGPVLAGFTEHRSLGPREVELLPELVMARLALTVLVPSWRSRVDPGLAPRLMARVPARRRALELLASMTPRRRLDELAAVMP